jgi:ATP-dependent DNA helicase RecQ
MKTDEAQKRVAQNHLNTIIAFAQTRQCRRIPLITYFGENYTVANCGQCDNCTKPQEASINLTVQAVKFLQCISETEERFGAIHVINVLRGSEAEKILNYNHHNCRTFGAGRDWSVKQWQNLAQQLLSQDLLDKSDDYGVLSLNQSSYEVLSNKRPFQGYLLEENILPAKTRSKEGDAYDTTLFEKLRAKRKELADKSGVPPYIIFSDKSLIDMCHRKPQTKAQFAEVFGVGEQKLEKYSAVFMRVINS